VNRRFQLGAWDPDSGEWISELPRDISGEGVSFGFDAQQRAANDAYWQTVLNNIRAGLRPDFVPKTDNIPTFEDWLATANPTGSRWTESASGPIPDYLAEFFTIPSHAGGFSPFEYLMPGVDFTDENWNVHLNPIAEILGYRGTWNPSIHMEEAAQIGVAVTLIGGAGAAAGIWGAAGEVGAELAVAEVGAEFATEELLVEFAAEELAAEFAAEELAAEFAAEELAAEFAAEEYLAEELILEEFATEELIAEELALDTLPSPPPSDGGFSMPSPSTIAQKLAPLALKALTKSGSAPITAPRPVAAPQPLYLTGAGDGYLTDWQDTRMLWIVGGSLAALGLLFATRREGKRP
jgi:hypothetical protein